jgi:aryl-alcohol dehydrogenase-like predicted oxidoreductase
MHHIDRATPWEEIWQAMEILVQQGKVLYIGSSNFAAWHLAQANEMARSRHFLGLVCEQSKYNLLTRHVELELIPCCERYGIGLIPWSPLASGALSGSGRQGKIESSRRTHEWSQSARNEHAEALSKYEALCKTLGEEPADIAIAWLLSQRVVTAPIIGPRTQEQLAGSLHALDIRLDADTLAQLDAIFPGYKPAPEEYAW